MQNLIKITKNEIGTENINSVNAREIYFFLEVRTAFSNWIKRAIEKYDFKENIDYVLVIAKNGINPKGGRPEQDYIVTIDMAKELAMLENNPKGKEARKYFINIEKEYFKGLSSNFTLQDIKRACIEAVKDEFLETKYIIKDELKETRSIIRDVMSNVIAENQNFLDEAKSVVSTKSLTAEQLDILKTRIENKAKELSTSKKIRYEIAIKTIYSDLNSYYGIKSWYHLMQGDYDEALFVINNVSLDRGA